MNIHILLVIVSITLISFVSQEVFGQTQLSEQTTLSGDLANNPVAQDILRKIEQTKQWIADLEQREYEKIQAQKLLEEKRGIALERLNHDLEQWENLWSNYTSRASFERFVDEKPSEVQGVFWDAFEFKEMKVQAGRDALKEVKANGGSLKEAREAYLKAAETKRIELIEQNTKFNVKHNLAYYQEQILFNKQGEFIETDKSQEKLSAFYFDYKNNPAYLAANPDDKFAAEAIQTNPDTQCREGYVVIYRYQQKDYACVTEFSAQQWIRYGIGELPGIVEILREEGALSQNSNVIKNQEEINEQIDLINENLKIKQVELKDLYKEKYQYVDVSARAEEKQVLKEYTDNNISKQELTQKLSAVRSQVGPEKDKILEQKLRALEELKIHHENKILDILDEYQSIFDIKIVWNSDSASYDLIWN